MKKVILFLLLGFITKANYAQSDSSKLSSGGMIQYSRPSFFRAGKITVNGKEETFREINTRLLNTQVSADEFKLYKKNRDLTYYIGGVAIASCIALIAKGANSSTFNNTSSKVLIGAAWGFIIPVGIFAGKRNRHYRRSVELYNQQFQ